MKYLVLIGFFSLYSTFGFSQSKKELEEQILQLGVQIKAQETEIANQQSVISALQTKNQTLETDINSLKLSSANSTSTITLMNTAIQELNKQMATQSAQMAAMNRKIDSLQNITASPAAPVDPNFISVPRTQDDSIYYVIQQYFGSKRWEDRLAYVLNPEQVKARMKEAYEQKYQQKSIPLNKINIQGSSFKLNDRLECLVGDDVIHLMKTKEGFRIDWEPTHGCNAFTLQQAYDQNKTEFTLRLRVMASTSPSLNENYPENQFRIYYILDSNGTNQQSSAYYALKSSDVDQQLMKICGDGDWHQVILTLEQDFYDNDDYNKSYLIKKLNSKSWLN